MKPANGDMKTITSEKHHELTDINVARCAEGTMELSSTSALICIRSSANAAMNPPAVIISATPVKFAKKPAVTTARQIMKMRLNCQ